MLGFTVNSAQAGETGEAVGGFAVVNPETGVIHGVIVGSVAYFGGNDRTMGSEYMGCPAGCLIVQQSTATENGNVVGMHGPNITYDNSRNVFQVAEPNITENQTVTESASNTSAIETEVSVSRSVRNYEFGVQDLRSNTGQFQMTEVDPAQNTSAQVSTSTKQFTCEESSAICSKRVSNNSTTLSEEVTSFTERKTSEQVLSQIVEESKVKIREQINLILSMLGKWILN